MAFIHVHYELPSTSVKRLYLQLVEPVIYASPAWWSDSPSVHLKNRLKSLQRLPMLGMTGAVQTTRTEVLNALTGIPPICEKLTVLRAQFLAFHLRSPVTYGLVSIQPHEVQRPFNPWSRHPGTRMACPFTRFPSQEALQMARSPGLHLYTDGAFSQQSAGAAFVAYGHTGRLVVARRYKVPSAGSAFMTELIALKEAFMYLLGYATARPVHLYTDCLSLLTALASMTTRCNEVDDLRALHALISRRTQLHLFHVRGHVGIFGNEVADHLAVRACSVGEPRSAALSVRVVRSTLEAEMWRRWSVNWVTQHADTELAKWLPDVRSLPPNFPPHKRVIFFITGHGRFPFYLYGLSLISSPTCFWGSSCLSIDHYMLACAGTTSFRRRLARLIRAEITPSRYPRLLRDPRAHAILKEMMEHINHCMPCTD